MNPQPSVLETDALPIELHPYNQVRKLKQSALNQENRYTTSSSSGGGIRTLDLQVMSLASCLCSTPQQFWVGSYEDKLGTPDSVLTVICLRLPLLVAWQCLACRVLFCLTATAAMRPNQHRPGPLTLLSAARSPSQPRYRKLLVGSYPTVSLITLKGQKYFLLRL